MNARTVNVDLLGKEPRKHEDMVIVCGTASGQLSESVCAAINTASTRVSIDTFSDGEVRIEFFDNLRGKVVYLIQSLGPPVNRNLMELLLLADAARRASAERVFAVVPYLGYSRQDRRPRGVRTPISARLVADMIGAAGIDRMVTIDLHAEQIQGFYRIPVDNLYASSLLLGDISRQLPKMDCEPAKPPVMIAPDVGGVQRARVMASRIDFDLAIIDKRRPRANVAEVMNVIGDVAGRHCFLVDDMIDTAGTLCAAAQALDAAGARSVRAYCTHLLLSGNAVERIESSVLADVVGTDTIPLAEKAAASPKIRTLSVAELLAETLMRIEDRQSIGSLFMD